jgi:hypothetical protein
MNLAPVVDDNGVTLGWVTPGDPLLEAVLRSAARREAAEQHRRAAVRAGELPAEPWSVWNISDRD